MSLATAQHAIEAGSPSQTSSEMVAQAVVRVLPTVVRLLVADMHDAPGADGLNFAQFRMLARLSERDYRPAELAAILDVGRPTLTVSAEHLVRRGLIERLREASADRRAVTLRLTPAGRTLYHSIEARSVATMAELLSGTSSSERTALALGLSALKRCLTQTGRSVLPWPVASPEGGAS